jgi:hypothetical protein
MKFYFAGSEPSILRGKDARLDVGVQRYLQSFFYLQKYNLSDLLKGKDLLMDSGGFTARTAGKPISVEAYAKWLVANDVRLAFNLDTNDLGETLRNQKYLEKHTRAYIIPIYHLSDYLEARELLQDFMHYPYIGLGGVAGERGNVSIKDELYRYVFRHTRDRVRVHGLGITSDYECRNYPFYSVDSSSWLSMARYGRSLFESELLAHYRSKTQPWLDNSLHECRNWLKWEADCTALWHARGVRWKEFKHEEKEASQVKDQGVRPKGKLAHAGREAHRRGALEL